MFICLGKYTRPLAADDEELITCHRAYLDELYARGELVCSGPRQPRVGGLIVVRTSDRAAAEALIAEDPFVEEGVAEYELLQFTATKAMLPELVEQSA
ncbi:YciI family protein [Streptomyces sp. NPDC091215]|uniref:YciI family protein n=1 Tax=Streptomyces sp. NPDC091215 TaxID=3155192 RepID=UPI003430042E